MTEDAPLESAGTRLVREIRHVTHDAIGEAYLQQLAGELGGRLGLGLVLVGLFSGTPPDRVRTYAAWRRGIEEAAFEFALEGAACAGVVDGLTCIHADAVAESFPRDALLREGGFRAYAGLPLRGCRGDVLGLLAAADDRPFEDAALVVGVLEQMAPRAGTELEQLLHSRKMEAIGTLAGGIAHDFNNILAAIVGHAEIARFDVGRTEQVERSLDEILRASQRARDLVSQFRTFFTTKGHGQDSGLGLAAQGAGRVLFIDDEVAILDVGRRMLARLGFECDTFNHPTAALDAFRADPSRWDLVITDFALPALAGTTVAETIQTIRPGMPVVLTTGYAAGLGAEEQAQASIIAVLPKPFSFADLAALVGRVLPPPV